MERRGIDGERKKRGQRNIYREEERQGEKVRKRERERLKRDG